ncbi:MAG: T9SS type A sorting domain-containing protein [Saprospiraceae bacterium]
MSATKVELIGSPVFSPIASPKYQLIQYGTIELSVTPNPFFDDLHVYLNLPDPMTANLTLFNLNGQVVMRFVTDEKLAKGAHAITLDGRDLPPGIYILHFEASNGRKAVRKVIRN